MAKPARTKNKDNARRAKKKTSILVQESVDYIDWKDVNLLRRFMSERAKIRARRVTGNDAQQQREVARAIKNAREMALLPYANRITTQRSPRGAMGAGAPTSSGPPPRPTTPPPGPGSAQVDTDVDVEVDVDVEELEGLDDLGAPAESVGDEEGE
jgi:small subunit ribosomal protein S18